MRALFVSDLHANTRLPLARVDDGNVSSDRLMDVMDVMDQVRTHADQVQAGAIFILGDLFDQKAPDGATLVHTARALRDMAATCPTYVLPGNHDAVDRDGRLYNLQMYAELDVPGLHVLGHEHIEIVDGVLIHAVPWLPEARARKKIRERERRLSQGDRHVLVFHQGILGALWDSGRRSDDGLDGTIGEAFELALTGHYHRPQEFESGRYIGSPLDLKFGDEAVDVRGFLDIDLATSGPLKPVVVPTTYPRFTTVRVDLRPGDLLEDVLDFEAEVAGVGAGYARLEVHGTARDVEANKRAALHWKEVVETTRPNGLRRLKLDLRPEREARVRLEVDATMSLAQMVKKFGHKFAPEEMTKPQRAALIRQGLDFVEGL